MAKTPTKVIFEVSPELRDRFKEVAESRQRTMSGQLRWLMEQAVAEAERVDINNGDAPEKDEACA